MKIANGLARKAAQEQGQRMDRQLEDFVYKCKMERRSNKYARVMGE